MYHCTYIKHFFFQFVGDQQRQMIIDLYISKMIKQATLPNQLHLKYTDLIKLISQATGIVQGTISSTLSEYKRNSLNRKKVRPMITEKVNEFDKNSIRRKLIK